MTILLPYIEGNKLCVPYANDLLVTYLVQDDLKDPKNKISVMYSIKSILNTISGHILDAVDCGITREELYSYMAKTK
jgi:hypothetical protein